MTYVLFMELVLSLLLTIGDKRETASEACIGLRLSGESM